MKEYTKADIFSVIDREIKKQMRLKNEYIEKNGFAHIDAIRAFDASIATLTSLYYVFEADNHKRNA